jgi:hypothetical protein
MTSSEPGRAWRGGSYVPADFVPEAVVAEPDGAGWLHGWRGGPAVELRTGVILRVTAAGVVTEEWSSPGWIRAGDRRGHVGFAVWARPGPVFTLLRAASDGAWSEIGPIPAASVTQVRAVGPDEAWMLGAKGLVVWAGGAFRSVEPPAPIDVTRDRVFTVANTLTLATHTGLHLARDGGRRWGHRAVDGHVRALAFPYCVADRGGRLCFGKLDAAFVDWVGTVEGEGDPVAFSWAGGAMQLALAPRDPARHPGLLLVASAPGGGFTTSLLRVPPTEGWIGLAGAGGALALAADRRLLQSGPT